MLNSLLYHRMPQNLKLCECSKHRKTTTYYWLGQLFSCSFDLFFFVTSGRGCWSCLVSNCCVLQPLMWLLRLGKLLQTRAQKGHGIKTGLACFLRRCSFACDVCFARCPHFLHRIFQRSPGTSTFSNASHKSDESVNQATYICLNQISKKWWC